MSYIAFPNLTKDGVSFLLNRTAFTLFGRSVAWYGVILTLGILFAVVFVLLRSKKEGILEDDVYDSALFTVLFGVIGARLYYVIFDPNPDYHSFVDVIAIWRGGIGIYGALIAGALTIFVVCRVKKMSFTRFADIVAPAVMAAQAIGRWGNFVNGEAYGSVEKFDFFFRSFDISGGMENYPLLMVVNGRYAQPTFLYESLWNLIGFALIAFLVHPRRRFAGETVLCYFGWYGFGRMFVEGLRTDSLYLPGSDVVRVSQLVGLVTFVACTAALIVLLIRQKKTGAPLAPVYYGKGAKRAERLKKEEEKRREARRAARDLIREAEKGTDEPETAASRDAAAGPDEPEAPAEEKTEEEKGSENDG